MPRRGRVRPGCCDDPHISQADGLPSDLFLQFVSEARAERTDGKPSAWVEWPVFACPQPSVQPLPCADCDCAARKRVQLMPSFRMRERSVCGLMPNRRAAPKGPSTRPYVAVSALSM